MIKTIKLLIPGALLHQAVEIFLKKMKKIPSSTK